MTLKLRRSILDADGDDDNGAHIRSSTSRTMDTDTSKKKCSRKSQEKKN